MTRRLSLIAVALLAAACASDPRTSEPPARNGAPPELRTGGYRSDAGELPVGTIPDARVRDTQRNRDLIVDIEYPITGGPYPLIVWSHGYGMPPLSYVGLSSYWTSNGYVVMRPRHADTGRAAATAADDSAPTQTLAEIRDRARDITAVLDALDALERDYPELQGKIDRARIGAGGHAYGAVTAMLASGLRLEGDATAAADPRVKALIAMSPPGPSERRGLTRESYANIRVPALFMTGTQDRGVDDTETPEWRREAFALSPAGDKWFISIENARHATFTGRPLYDLPDDPSELAREERQRRRMIEGVRDPATQRIVDPGRAQFSRAKVYSIAFWDLYLKNENRGRELLTKVTNIETK